MIETGAQAPDVELADQDGETGTTSGRWRSSDLGRIPLFDDFLRRHAV